MGRFRVLICCFMGANRLFLTWRYSSVALVVARRSSRDSPLVVTATSCSFTFNSPARSPISTFSPSPRLIFLRNPKYRSVSGFRCQCESRFQVFSIRVGARCQVRVSGLGSQVPVRKILLLIVNISLH